MLHFTISIKIKNIKAKSICVNFRGVLRGFISRLMGRWFLSGHWHQLIRFKHQHKVGNSRQLKVSLIVLSIMRVISVYVDMYMLKLAV